MKKAIFLLVLTSAFVGKCQEDYDYSNLYTKKQPKKKTTTTPPPERVDVSFENFDVPRQILVSTFKNIMEKVSGYKRGVYCPFKNQNDCGRESALSGAITKIIDDEVKASKDPVLEQLKHRMKNSKNKKKRKFKRLQGRSGSLKKKLLNLKLNFT